MHTHRQFLYKALVLFLSLLSSECFKWQSGVYEGTVFANRSQVALFRWKYVLGQVQVKLSNLKIECGYIPKGKPAAQLVTLVKKVGHNKPMMLVAGLPGRSNTRVEAYQENLRDGQVDRSVVGFKIMLAQLTHPRDYMCLAVYELQDTELGTKYSIVKKLVVIDPPVLKRCLEGLPPVEEGKDMEFSCYVTGNPVPTLQCQLLSGFGVVLQQVPKQATAMNISRQLFTKIPREAEEIMCIADGTEAGKTNLTVLIEVHHTPSAPEFMKFIPAVNTSSLNVMWSVIRMNETGGEIMGYQLGYYKTKDLEVTMTIIDLTVDKLGEPLDDGYYTYYTYEIHGLYPDDQYTVLIRGYNQFGAGHVLQREVTPAHIDPMPDTEASASVGAIVGGIIAGIVFIVLFVVLAVWCSTRSKKREKLPTSIVEDAVDYPQGVGLYANVDKNRNKTSIAGSGFDYPDVVNNGADKKPLTNSNSYEPSNKSFV